MDEKDIMCWSFFYLMFTIIGGMFMATGGTDHMVRVYYLGADTPMKVSEMDAHTVKKPSFWIFEFLSLRYSSFVMADAVQSDTC